MNAMNRNKADFCVTDSEGNPLVPNFPKFELAFAHLKKASLQQRDREFWLHIRRPGQGWQLILTSKDIA